MHARAEKLRRIVEVQQQLLRAQEWKLRDLQRQLAHTEAAERETLAALGDEHALHGLFLDARARRLRALAGEAARIRGEIAAQSRKVLESSAKLKTAERLAATAALALRREADKKRLVDVIDDAVAAKTQASGKFLTS